jgi:hypothetical protein
VFNGFCFFFSSTRRWCLWGHASRPPRSASPSFFLFFAKPSAKQNYAFCLFFWKKKSSIRLLCLCGHALRPPGSCSREVYGYRAGSETVSVRLRSEAREPLSISSILISKNFCKNTKTASLFRNLCYVLFKLYIWDPLQTSSHRGVNLVSGGFPANGGN